MQNLTKLPGMSNLLTPTNTTIITKASVILIATAALFFQDLALIFSDALQNEATSYMIAIPFIFCYLLYRKRKMLSAVIPLKWKSISKELTQLPNIAGILLSLTAILLYWYGSYTFTPLEIHMSALPLFVTGLVLILFNPQTLRQLIFPIAFLAFLIPPPSEFLYWMGSTLSVISSQISFMIVNALGVPSVLSSEYNNPTILITRPDNTTIPFSVDIACSGVYGLIGFLVFAAFMAYMIRDKLPKKLVIVVVGLPLIYMINIVRITTILLIGYNFGQELALEVFHLLGGWILIFLGTILLIAITDRFFHLNLFVKKMNNCPECTIHEVNKKEICDNCGKILHQKNLKITRPDILKISGILLSVIVLISINVPVFAFTEAPSISSTSTSGEQDYTNFLPEIPGYRLEFLYRNSSFEKFSKQDFSLLYVYKPTESDKKTMWATLEVASTTTALHRWEVCLITYSLTHGYEPKARQIDLKDVQLIDNPPLFGRYFVFQDKTTNETQAVLYWFETATFQMNSTSEQKHVKISFIALPKESEDLQTVETQLRSNAEYVASYWEPIKSWSQVALLFSLNGDLLSSIAFIILLVLIAYYLITRRKVFQKNMNAVEKLSDAHKELFDIILKTEKTCIPTLQNIMNTFCSITNKLIEKTQLIEDLSTIEKTGLLKRTIVNENDEPISAWKTQIIN